MNTLRAVLCTVVLACLVTSCQSMSEGILTFEARAILIDDTSIDTDDIGASFMEEDVDLTGYGGHVALMTPILDIVGGVDYREYESSDTPEIVLGVRRRFLEFWRLHPFVEGNLRYGTDVDASTLSEDYTAWAVGIGAMLDLTSNLFLNVRVMYETTPIETPAGEVDVEGVLGTVGIGLSF